MRVALSLACNGYDRTEALRDGSVRPEGVELTYLDLPVEETFFRMTRYREFDVSEYSLGSYVASLRQGRPFVAIPVFPSRSFRHNGIYVNTAAGIETPAQLAGRKVGIAEWQLTANVWIRGILAEHYGLAVDAVEYRVGGLHEGGRVEKLPVDLPKGVRIDAIPDDRTLSEMLVEGEIDALYTPRTPQPFAKGRPEVARLFPNAAAEEEAYYRATGVFPIMHTVVLRRELYEDRPWLVRSLMKAFEEAKARIQENMDDTVAPRYMLPWLHEEVRRTKEVLGKDYWPYGIEPNRKVLSTFLRYAADQGVGDELSVEDLFARESFEHVVV